MKNIKKVFYIAELNLPNSSAYSVHVMKMCEALIKKKFQVELYVISNTQNKEILQKSYNINEFFNIKAVFKKEKLLNFFIRFYFSIFILLRTNHANSIFISRSILFGIIASFFKKNIILELHHEITGLSLKIYKLFKKLNLIKNLKYIFLHKALKKKFNLNNNYLILDDCVNLEDFKKHKNIKKENAVVYLGSFHDGKGIDKILKIAQLNKKINFHIYGDRKFLKKNIKIDNIKVFDFVKYRYVPEILSKYCIAIMPYEKKVKGRGLIEIQKYMSPLKMFDYMAARNILIASDLSVYNHLLKNNYNSILIKNGNINLFNEAIEKILKNPKKFSYLANNAYLTCKNFTWNNRLNKIINKFF